MSMLPYSRKIEEMPELLEFGHFNYTVLVEVWRDNLRKGKLGPSLL